MLVKRSVASGELLEAALGQADAAPVAALGRSFKPTVTGGLPAIEAEFFVDGFAARNRCSLMSVGAENTGVAFVGFSFALAANDWLVAAAGRRTGRVLVVAAAASGQSGAAGSDRAVGVALRDSVEAAEGHCGAGALCDAAILERVDANAGASPDALPEALLTAPRQESGRQD
jgi:hypothetical protein